MAMGDEYSGDYIGALIVYNTLLEETPGDLMLLKRKVQYKTITFS